MEKREASGGKVVAGEGGLVAYFGYGSLVCRATHRTEIVAAVPARLGGWRRLWRPRPDMPGFPAALLTVRPEPGAGCDGLLVFDRAENLAAIDARETRYRRVALKPSDLELAATPPADCPIWLYVAQEELPPHPEPPAILQSYLDVVMLGFLIEHGEGGLARFLAGDGRLRSAAPRRPPPLVFAGEARALKRSLARVAQGEAFLLQGGDCAESFAEHSANNIRDFFRVFLQMAVVLTFAGALPVVKVGRIAGQFAKPRSSPTEKQGDVELPAYRGDIINDIAFTPEGARPIRAACFPPTGSRRRRSICCAPSRPAAMPMSRTRISGCSASSRTARNPRATRRSRRASPRRSTSCAPAASTPSRIPKCAPRISTRATKRCLLGYEQAMTRVDSTSGDWYDTSGHMIWIGDRTRQPDHAHVEYCRGIKNPIGLKCGPTLKPDGMLKLLDILDPDHEPGRITLICRFGAGKVGEHLPALIEAIRRSARPSSGPAIRCTATRSPRTATRPAASSRSCRRRRSSSTCMRRGHACGRHPSGNDRQGRHRMHRRRARDQRTAIERPLPHGLRSASQRRTGDRNRLPPGSRNWSASRTRRFARWVPRSAISRA
jgi:3-deoxy-7-phosphoheptulonate synthase